MSIQRNLIRLPSNSCPQISAIMQAVKMPVAIVKYREALESLKRAIELSNGFENLRMNSKVLVKPNIAWGGRASKKSPKFGTVTTSRLVEYLIQLLREWGCNDIVIGEGTVVNKELGSDTFRGYELTGIDRVARKYGVKLVDFHKEPFKRVKVDGIEIGISTIALESDFLINVPVLKTHSQTKVSLGLKNLKGCLDMKSRRESHKRDLDRSIALLNTQLAPELTIVDGIYALEQGPDFLGTAHRMNLIIAGRDNLSCDIVCSSILGINPSSVGHLQQFASIAGRSLNIDTVDVRGEGIKEVVKKLKWERSYEDLFRQAGVRGITFQDPGKHFCSGCLVPWESVLLAFSKDNQGTNLENVEVCCGTQANPQKGSKSVFLIGNCAIRTNKDLKNAVLMKGCPIDVRKAFFIFTKHTLGTRRAIRLLMIRFFKNLANRIGIYDEDFPLYRRYEPPEFDAKHFK